MGDWRAWKSKEEGCKGKRKKGRDDYQVTGLSDWQVVANQMEAQVSEEDGEYCWGPPFGDM